MGRSPSRLALLLISLAVVCIRLIPPSAQAVRAATGRRLCRRYNTAEGTNALFNLTTGVCEHSGWLVFALEQHQRAASTQLAARDRKVFNRGNENTAIGAASLLSNTIGSNNTANGAFALRTTQPAANNAATGGNALKSNTIGSTATRPMVFERYRTTPPASTTRPSALSALQNNTTGHSNMAIGRCAGNQRHDGR